MGFSWAWTCFTVSDVGPPSGSVLLLLLPLLAAAERGWMGRAPMPVLEFCKKNVSSCERPKFLCLLLLHELYDRDGGYIDRDWLEVPVGQLE